MQQLIDLFASRGCEEVLIKELAARQDNDKNQIYVGKDLADVGKLPTGEVVASTTNSTKQGASGRSKFQAALPLTWLCHDGESPAPNAKIIYYPQYPEVRLSGFLSGSAGAPRALLSRAVRGQEPGRTLLLGISSTRRAVYGLVLPPESDVTRSLERETIVRYGVFSLWQLEHEAVSDGLTELLDELRAIVAGGWHKAVRLEASGNLVPCIGTNCGGYTLEALLGVVPNGRAEPDFQGWEIKQHAVSSLSNPRSGAITLFTPEPTGGNYKIHGVEGFVRVNGYRTDRNRWDFAGIHRVGASPNERTGTRLVLSGYRGPYDFDAHGSIDLIDRYDLVAASWSFAKLMEHWKRKHAATCFVASESSATGPAREYRYSPKILLGRGATFPHLLSALEEGRVYYDPGINLRRDAQGRWTTKRRSQFRTRFADVDALYSSTELVSLNDTTN